MPSAFDTLGRDDAILALGFEKRAFLGAALNVGKAALRPVGRTLMRTSAGRAMAPSAGRVVSGIRQLTKGVGGIAGGAERAVGHTAARGAGALAKRLGKDRAGQAAWMQGAKNMTRGVPREIIQQGVAGGLIVGGMGAYSAEDGQGWDAFKSGFGEGAGMGALSGVAGGGIRNLRRTGLRQQATRQLAKNPAAFGGMSANRAAEQQLNQRLRDTMGGVVTGKGPMGRAGNITDTLGVAGQVSGEMFLPGAVLAAGGMGESPHAPPTPPQAPPQQYQMRTASTNDDSSDDPNEVERILAKYPRRLIGSAVGSATGYALGGIPLALAREAGHLKGPSGTLAQGLIPAITGITGGLTGYTLGSKYDEPPPVVQNINQVDFDRLLKHYKKDPGA